jgi:thioester reductase-like protein
MNKILFTGATGFIGRHLLLKYYTHTDAKLYCLLRTNQDEALERICKALDYASKETGIATPNNEEIRKRIQVFNWDLCTPLDFDACENWLGGKVDSIWHLAAKLGFSARLASKLMQTNSSGIDSLIDLAISNNAVLNYVSTAYTCGQQVGYISEILHSELIPTNNPYETSKRAAEKKIVVSKLKYRIFRPTIVVGSSITGEGDSPFGYYGFLSITSKIFNQVKKKVPSHFNSNSITLLAHPDASLNLIPVDMVAALMFDIASKVESSNQIFHIASDSSVPIKHIPAIVEGNLGIKITLTNDANELNRIDRLLHNQVKDFQSYLGEPKHFCTKNTKPFVREKIYAHKISDEFMKIITDKFYARYNGRCI